MTKNRRHRTLPHALGKIIGELTPDVMADHLGLKSPSTVYNYGDPNHTACPTVLQAISLDLLYMRETGKAPPIFEFIERKIAEAGLPDTDQDIVSSLLGINHHIGRLNATVKAARDPEGPDGSDISDCEKLAILKEADRVRRQIDEMEKCLKSPTLKEVK